MTFNLTAPDALVYQQVYEDVLVLLPIRSWGQGCWHAVVVLPQVRDVSWVESYQQLGPRSFASVSLVRNPSFLN